MIKVVLLGGGNLAFQLIANLISNKNISLIQVYNRTLEHISEFKSEVAITNKLNDLKKADIYILAISDNAIEEVANKLKSKSKFIVHTSGATSIDALQNNSRNGVFYIPQSFTKNTLLDLSELPICIEASDDACYEVLNKFSKVISSKIYKVDSKQRLHLHLAAVFVNNFVNHLYFRGKEICEMAKVDFKILEPIIEETAKKIVGLDPFKVQTGPAVRKDLKTLEIHKQLLNKDQIEIYNALTQSILKTHGEKL